MPTREERTIIVKRLLSVAWLAVVLGFVFQILVLVAKLGAGAKWPGAALLADFAQGITWSVLVCVGTAIGTIASSARTAAMGLLGAISGPFGWGVAKAVQRSVQQLAGAPVDKIAGFFYLLCGVKGIIYLILGGALGYLITRKSDKWHHYAIAGAVVGVLEAVAMVGLNMWHAQAAGAPMTTPQIIGMAVGEFTFPIGCAMVIYTPLHLRKFFGLG